MAIKKLTATEKVERAKMQILRALEQIKGNPNKTEVLGYVTGQLAHTYALLDADKADEMAMVFVAVSIMDEISPKERKPILGNSTELTQLELGEK